MSEKSAAEQINDIIRMYGGWKGELLAQIREVALGADTGITEEIKWKMATRPEGLPVWSHGGIVCYAETWKDNIKLLFPKGAKLADPKKLFNARLQSAGLRAIEFHEGDTVNTSALKALIVDAVKQNS